MRREQNLRSLDRPPPIRLVGRYTCGTPDAGGYLVIDLVVLSDDPVGEMNSLGSSTRVPLSWT